MTTLLKIAAERGYGNTKVAWLDPAGQIQTAVIPSVVGIGQIGDLSLLGLGRQRKHTHPYTVAFDGISYLAGENVHRHAQPIEDLSHTALAEGTVTRSLLYAALGRAVNGRPVQVKLMLGFPVELLRDKEQGLATLRELRKWLVGRHCFTIDGRPVDAEVLQIKPGSQPAGAYLDWGMDATGQWIRDLAGLKKPCAVCDVGFNTIDLFSVQGGEIMDGETRGADLGMHRVAEIVAAHVRGHYEVDLSFYQSDNLVREYLRTGRCSFACAAGDIDLAPVIQQALDRAFTDIVRFINQHWGNGRQFYTLIFTGGGAAAFRQNLLRQWPTGYLPPDPVTSNVRGLLKRAQRIFKDT